LRRTVPLDGATFRQSSDWGWPSNRAALLQHSGAGGWDLGTVNASRIIIAGNQVVGARGTAISDPSGGAVIDAEARTALEQILICLRQHGLIS
jgi:hypothetical protein